MATGYIESQRRILRERMGDDEGSNATLDMARAIVRNQFDPERSRKVVAAVEQVRQLIREYGFFNRECHGLPLDTPSAFWNEDEPEEVIWFTPFGADGLDIPEAALAGLPREQWPDSVAETRLILMGEDEEGDLSGRVLSFVMAGPNPATYDVVDGTGTQLTGAEIDGVMLDMQQYAAAVMLGRIEHQAGITP